MAIDSTDDTEDEIGILLANTLSFADLAMRWFLEKIASCQVACSQLHECIYISSVAICGQGLQPQLNLTEILRTEHTVCRRARLRVMRSSLQAWQLTTGCAKENKRLVARSAAKRGYHRMQVCWQGWQEVCTDRTAFRQRLTNMGCAQDTLLQQHAFSGWRERSDMRRHHKVSRLFVCPCSHLKRRC